MRGLSILIQPLNLARLLVAAVLAFSLIQLGEMKPPGDSAWARKRAAGISPSYREHLQVGLWAGTAAVAGLSAVLLGLSLGWGWRKPVPRGFSLRLSGTSAFPVSPRAFTAAVGIIVLGALAMRLPRMNHSFWGDEADAVATYIHGQFRPLNMNRLQGPMKFEQPMWHQTFFSARHGPNNHVPFSVLSRISLLGWQDWNDRKAHEFTEWPLRLPSLLAGLGSLVTLALLLRRWGEPGLGLLAAAFMALHPWHVRYSTEARGYAIALCLLPVFLHGLTDALERSRWRDWLRVALVSFLLMWTWPGVAYPLAFLNVTAFGFMLRRSDRGPLLVRWATANVLAAAAFLALYAPHLPQIQDYNSTHLWMKGGPMDERWMRDVMTFPFTGIPYTRLLPSNPAEISWQKLIDTSPIFTTTGFALILGAVAVGIVFLFRRNRRTAALVVSVLVSAVVCAFHFKFFIGDEMRPWYLLFTLPFLSICAAAGLLAFSRMLGQALPAARPSPLRVIVPVLLLLTLTTASVWPMNHSLMTRASEDFKGAAAATRGRHEVLSTKGGTTLFTVWLWRHAALYDPRGGIHVRNAVQLEKRMREVRVADGELYVIVGFRQLAEGMSADMLQMLDNPALFEKTGVFPASLSMHTLEVWRMKK